MDNELIIELEEKDNIEICINSETNVEVELENSDTVSTGMTTDYRKLKNKPKIEGVELVDNKTFEELGMSSLSNSELEKILM